MSWRQGVLLASILVLSVVAMRYTGDQKITRLREEVRLLEEKRDEYPIEALLQAKVERDKEREERNALHASLLIRQEYRPILEQMELEQYYANEILKLIKEKSVPIEQGPMPRVVEDNRTFSITPEGLKLLRQTEMRERIFLQHRFNVSPRRSLMGLYPIMNQYLDPRQGLFLGIR